MERRVFLSDERFRFSALMGDLSQADHHKHYSLHLVCSLNSILKMIIDSQLVSSNQWVALAQNTLHRFEPTWNKPVLLISFGPISNLGRKIRDLLTDENHIQFNNPELERIRELALRVYQKVSPKLELLKQLPIVLSTLAQNPFENDRCCYDKRILSVLRAFHNRPDQIISAKDFAKRLSLSESRFLHLFRSETGMTYRRMQIWLRLVKSFTLVKEIQSLTDLAHRCGFSDSAHFSRSFRETFGFSPSFFFQGQS